MKKRKTPALYVSVVVVMEGSSIVPSSRNSGGWASFVATTEDDACRMALDACAKWDKPSNGRHYAVLAGTLTGKVSIVYKIASAKGVSCR